MRLFGYTGPRRHQRCRRMEMSTETLVEFLREVEVDDSNDYTELSFGGRELRRLVMTSLVERQAAARRSSMRVRRGPHI